MSRYAELHCHTNFSFLDGASHPEDLAERAVELGYEALAVTDHDGFYGVSRFWQAAKETGLPVIYGVEISLEMNPGGASDPIIRAESWDQERYARTKGGQGRLRRGRSVRAHGTKPTDLPESDHLVLLSGSPDGYRELSHLITKAQMRGEKDHPIYNWGDLATAAANTGIHALTGCHAGAVPKAAANGDLGATIRAASRLRELFGPRLHMELWHHGMPEDDQRNDLMWEVAQKLGLSAVATNQVHYHDRRDAYLSEVLAAIGGRRTLAQADGFRPASDERYLKHPEEMAHRFARYPGVVARAGEMGRRLAFDLGLVAPRLPDFPMPEHFRDEMDYLRHLTWEGARDVYPGSDDGIDPEARRRLEHELDIIERLEFPGYFLVVKDLVDFARDQDIYCQIRGSGADSAVCRCIGLTRVDPIRLHLPFERFLSEERGKPPDIDIDFEADRREEVIQYCYRKYGRERAAMVANVITYRARSVLRDVAKTFGFTQAQVDGLSRYVDTRDPAQLRMDTPLPEGMTAEMIYDICWRLDGYPRHLGIHSGGMVIADRPLWQVVPLEWGRMEGRTVIQWDKDDSAAVGMVKFDLLGLGMLNALHLATDLIEDTHGIEIDLARIAQEPAIYRSMTRSDTVGLFQIESRAQMATLPKMKPKTFYDLAVEVALIRPGPIQGQSVHPYLRRRNGEEPVRYPHPSTKPVLEKTLGVPIFQEQLMELARICAGFNGSQADRLRQAMTHKRSDKAMARLQGEVYEGMAGNGITGAAADEIWEKLQGFASFGFPESHSVSFAYIVYMSAWLRFHYPAEYLAGLLNAQPMGFYSPNSLAQDAQRHGVVVLGPDVNVSWHDCTIEAIEADPDDIVRYLGQEWRRGRGTVDDPIRPPVGVRMGLRYVKNLGEKEVTRVEAARILGGEFTSPEDLAFRTGLDVDSLQGLAAAGALESVGLERREGMWAAGALAEIDPERLPLSPGVEAPGLEEMTEEESHRADLWSTGVSARHPMSFVRDQLEDCLTAAEALDMKRNGSRVKVAGVITHRQRPGTAKGVYFLNLEDETGLLNIVVLPDVWAKHRNVVRKSPALVIHGRLEYHDGVTNIVARDFEPLGVQTVRSRDFR
ncbi:MAG: error-prone DNA polymerase [Acidobacteria bacterium]|nr:error-prone DNA polymerase [Acidobacteriota bacterium]